MKGINPSICMHKILLEENVKTSIEHQRRLNPVMKEVVSKEILKWLNAKKLSNNPRVSPVHMVPKKGGFIVIRNEKNELIPTRTVTGWRVCIDYRKLNTATRKVTILWLSLIKCWTDWQDTLICVFLLDILDIIRLPKPLRTRRKPPLYVPMTPLIL